MNAPNLRTADTPSSEADRNISSMSGAIAMPRSNGESVFDAQWQSRAFGMAVSLSRAGYFSWDKFRAELARAIAQNGVAPMNTIFDGSMARWLDGSMRWRRR